MIALILAAALAAQSQFVCPYYPDDPKACDAPPRPPAGYVEVSPKLLVCHPRTDPVSVRSDGGSVGEVEAESIEDLQQNQSFCGTTVGHVYVRKQPTVLERGNR